MATSADAVEIVVVHDDQQSPAPKRKPHSAKKANRLTDQDTPVVEAPAVIEADREGHVEAPPPPWPVYCCVIASYDTSGDGCGNPAACFPYLAFCGSPARPGEIQGYYSLFGGCNLRCNPFRDWPPRR